MGRMRRAIYYLILTEIGFKFRIDQMTAESPNITSIATKTKDVATITDGNLKISVITNTLNSSEKGFLRSQ